MRTAAARADGLTARSFRLASPPDLLDYYAPAGGFFFERGGAGVVGVGAALRATIAPGPDQVARAAAEAAAMLAGIRIEGDAPPVVTGSLPFDGERDSGALIVPQIAIARRNGKAWMVVTGHAGMPEPETHPHLVPPEPSGPLSLEAVPPAEDYLAAVRAARALIAAGALEKVVLARTLVARSDHPFDVATLLERLRAVEPDCYVFGVEGLLGATPELLLARSGRTVRSTPLAGTAAREADPTADDAAARALLRSQKDRDEHAFVVRAVRAALEGACERLEVEPEPSVVPTSKVWHLSTEVRGILRSDAPGPPGALALAAGLHPTPAVCGTPTEAARAAIRDLERIERGLYAGLVGWTDARGDGEWAVALRCAEVNGDRARLYAGAGIVAGSDPDAELAETDAKFRAMIDALGYA